MANSAAAGQSELEIRKQLIQCSAVDVMVAIGSNFFYTVTLPCPLWFLAPGKALIPPNDPLPRSPLPVGEGLGVRARDNVLFLDACGICCAPSPT
jgi:type I restriction enzyme M protein